MPFWLAPFYPSPRLAFRVGIACSLADRGVLVDWWVVRNLKRRYSTAVSTITTKRAKERQTDIVVATWNIRSVPRVKLENGETCCGLRRYLIAATYIRSPTVFPDEGGVGADGLPI